MSNEEGDDTKIKTLIPMSVNSILGIADRIFQIVDYCLNRYKYKQYDYKTEEVQTAALTFCIMPTAVNAFMMGLYCIFHSEKNLTIKMKLVNFIRFLFSMEILYPIGAQKSLKTKYSYTADNVLITMRLVNAVHFMFVALPQILIIPINGSANDDGMQSIDIVSLIISCIFVFWTVGYYFLCIQFQNEYENLFTIYVDNIDNSKID